jgi:hypothetical protein
MIASYVGMLEGDLNFRRLLKETINLSNCVCCRWKLILKAYIDLVCHGNILILCYILRTFKFIGSTSSFLLCKIKSCVVQYIAINVKALNVFSYILGRTKTNLAVKI